jgi:hypothetical protein
VINRAPESYKHETFITGGTPYKEGTSYFYGNQEKQPFNNFNFQESNIGG